MLFILITKRNAANEFAIVADSKIHPHEIAVMRDRGLGDGVYAQTFSGEHEVVYIQTAIQRSIKTEVRRRGDKRDMGCAEKAKVFQHLVALGYFVFAGDLDCLVKLQAAGFAAFARCNGTSSRP